MLVSVRGAAGGVQREAVTSSATLGGYTHAHTAAHAPAYAPAAMKRTLSESEGDDIYSGDEKE